MKQTIRIGSGAGFSGDRFDAALALVQHASLDYLVLECLAERTIAIAQKAKKWIPIWDMIHYWKEESVPCYQILSKTMCD